jgi:hypothetical protein
MKFTRHACAKNLVFLLNGESENSLQLLNSDLHVLIKDVQKLTRHELSELGGLQGRLASKYLRWRYGSNGTRLLMLYLSNKLVHVQWIVSGKSIGKRYPFVKSHQWAIISCLTSVHARGLGIYPWALRVVKQSGIAGNYFIWAEEKNVASLKGIEKAGGRQIASFTQVKRLHGLLSKVVYEEALPNG